MSIPTPSAIRGSSLNECSRLLEAELGDKAPARITLHRHSTGGALDHLIVRRSATRAYFDPKRLVEHYLNLNPTARKEIKAKRAKRTAAREGGLDLDQVEAATNLQAELIAQKVLPLLAPRLDALFQLLEQNVPPLIKAAQDLASVRQSLMLKYDQVATQAVQRADKAEAEIRAKRNGDDPVQQLLMKVSISLSRLRDDIASLKPPEQ